MMKYILFGYFCCILIFVCVCNISVTREEKPAVNAKPSARIYMADIAETTTEASDVKSENDSEDWNVDDALTLYYHAGIIKDFRILLYASPEITTINKLSSDKAFTVAVGQSAYQK